MYCTVCRIYFYINTGEASKYATQWLHYANVGVNCAIGQFVIKHWKLAQRSCSHRWMVMTWKQEHVSGATLYKSVWCVCQYTMYGCVSMMWIHTFWANYIWIPSVCQPDNRGLCLSYTQGQTGTYLLAPGYRLYTSYTTHRRSPDANIYLSYFWTCCILAVAAIDRSTVEVTVNWKILHRVVSVC